jgi:hypothetical protein
VKPEQINLSYHRTKKLFYKTIGRGENGKQRMFWLGADQVRARHLAKVLSDYWKQNLQFMGQSWNKHHELRARSVFQIEGQVAQSAVEQAAQAVQRMADVGWLSGAAVPALIPATVAAPTAPNVTLKQAAERHIRMMKAKQLSVKHVGRAHAVHKQLFEVIPENTPLKGPGALGHDHLLGFVEHFLARPTSKLHKKPMAVESIKRVFQYTRALLEEIDGDSWDGSKGWRKLFKVRWTNLLTPAEQKKLAAGKDTFTVPELVQL